MDDELRDGGDLEEGKTGEAQETVSETLNQGRMIGSVRRECILGDFQYGGGGERKRAHEVTPGCLACAVGWTVLSSTKTLDVRSNLFLLLTMLSTH